MTRETLSDIYDEAFFAPYSARNPSYARSCGLIARELHRRFAPRTVVDWGCGAGLHLRAMADCGSRVVGVDGSDAAIAAAQGIEVVKADITQPVVLEWSEYDLALCIDVLEHIDERFADSVLQNVVQGAGMVILSCAPPNQGGHHHVNEQPRRYWVQRMARLGWEYQRKETSDLEGTFLGVRDRIEHTWMFHNLCIYLPKLRGRPMAQAFLR